jgi:hypothetical protein
MTAGMATELVGEPVDVVRWLVCVLVCGRFGWDLPVQRVGSCHEIS